MKKNVLQVIGSFHQGGSERQAVQLTRLLHEHGGYRVSVATMMKKGVLLDEIENIGVADISEFRLKSFFSLHFVRQLWEFSRFLRKNKIDIIHTHDFYTNIFGVLSARLAKTPVKIASKRETGGMRSSSQDSVEKFVFKISDAITVNAKAVGKYLIKRRIPEDKIILTYNGLDLGRFVPVKTNREKICEKLSLPKDENIEFITLVANFHHKVKNQPMLLKTAQRLRRIHPEAHFVFAGEGERTRYLMKMAKELEVSENTHFIGRCQIVAELLSISSICVSTSITEGFSNSILEYMAARKPVVATDVGGACEMIVDGKTGYLVDSDDDEAMAGYLSQLLDRRDTAVKMGKEGRKIVEERFSTQTQLQSVISLYQQLLEK